MFLHFFPREVFSAPLIIATFQQGHVRDFHHLRNGLSTNFSSGYIFKSTCLHPNEPLKKPSSFPFYWLFNRGDPYTVMVNINPNIPGKSIYPIHPKKTVFFHCSNEYLDMFRRKTNHFKHKSSWCFCCHPIGKYVLVQLNHETPTFRVKINSYWKPPPRHSTMVI